MVEIKKILVPTDFSDGSERVYPVAQSVADTFGSTIDFIHVIPTLKYFNESIKKLGVPLDMEKDLYPKIIDDSERSIEKAMDQYLKEENKGDHFVKIERKPSEAIAEFAKKNKYDLVLMGTRGADETSMLRGSVTERVIRKSTVPVFSIGERFDLNKVENVVLTTDSSEMSLAALPLAVALADTFDARLTLFHVIELYGSASEDIPREPGKGENVSIYEAIIERINEYLAGKELDNIHIQRTGVTFEDEVVISDGEESRSIPLFTRIEKGVSAHYEIENYASEEADILIMATHGHSGFAHLILGSTAEKVAQYVKKPVITVRPPEEEFEE
ncbi:MAG: universal stress protein [Balneolaceae bacterium]|nr:universal stress protein [Balneolaceae bacterium]